MNYPPAVLFSLTNKWRKAYKSFTSRIYSVSLVLMSVEQTISATVCTIIPLTSLFLFYTKMTIYAPKKHQGKSVTKQVMI